MTSREPTAVAVTNSKPIDYETFQESFPKACNTWFSSSSISTNLQAIVESFEVTAEQFETLTQNLQLQRYITLIDGKIHFDELPGPPHREIIGEATNLLGKQLADQISTTIGHAGDSSGISSTFLFSTV
jgi:hypothetical protein